MVFEETLHHNLSFVPGHTFEGGISFVVDRALREGTSVSVRHFARQMVCASPDRRLSVSAVETELVRVALRRGASIEFG